MKAYAIKTRLFKEGGNLNSFLGRHLPALQEKSVVAVASKIVALAEGRTRSVKNEQEKFELIKQESDLAIPTKLVAFTIKNQQVMASAGIDASNANGKLVLLPQDSFTAAENIRQFLRRRFGLKNIGVVITDSCDLPLRKGTIGMALGYAGFRGLNSYRGKKDLFGRSLAFSRVTVADSLATVAALLMGEGKEKQPLAVLEDLPMVAFRQRIDRTELLIDPQEDMYAPLFKNLFKGR